MEISISPAEAASALGKLGRAARTAAQAEASRRNAKRPRPSARGPRKKPDALQP